MVPTVVVCKCSSRETNIVGSHRQKYKSSNVRTGVVRESLRFTTFMNSAVRVPRVLTGIYSVLVVFYFLSRGV